MKRLKALTAASLITSLLGTPLSAPAKVEALDFPKRRPLTKGPAGRPRTLAELPADPALPALVDLRAACRAGAFQASDPGARPLEFLVRNYKPGRRVVIEVRAGRERFAVKVYSSDPALEVRLYVALAAAGLGGDSVVRVPPLLAYEHRLRMLIIGWLDGPTAQELIRAGHGARAGELAAHWLHRAASLSVKLGPPFGAASVRKDASKWVARLCAMDPALAAAATALGERLARTQPKEGEPRLVHGSLYTRHILDLGDGAGLIDWNCFGQGPPEIDAGMFLATVSRTRLLSEHCARQAARAEQAFLSGTAGLLDQRALAWQRAAALLHLAERGSKPTTRRPSNWRVRASVLLVEAARLAEAAG